MRPSTSCIARTRQWWEAHGARFCALVVLVCSLAPLRPLRPEPARGHCFIPPVPEQCRYLNGRVGLLRAPTELLRRAGTSGLAAGWGGGSRGAKGLGEQDSRGDRDERIGMSERADDGQLPLPLLLPERCFCCLIATFAASDLLPSPRVLLLPARNRLAAGTTSSASVLACSSAALHRLQSSPAPDHCFVLAGTSAVPVPGQQSCASSGPDRTSSESEHFWTSSRRTRWLAWCQRVWREGHERAVMRGSG